jgi:hypothetical protein
MSRGTWQGSGTWQTTGGGGRLVLAVIAAAVLIGSGAASAIASALVTILIVIGSIIGLAVLGGIAWLVYRARQDRPGRPIVSPAVYRLPPGAPPRLQGPGRPALEPGRELHLHLTVSADQLAAIMRHYTEEDV